MEKAVINHDNENVQVEPKKYDKHKWKKIMDTTQSNYVNMRKRLSRRNKISNFALIYYSIFLIINTLTCKYFPAYFNAKLSEYFGIIISIIVLVYSLINNNANYPVRITKIEDSINKMKTIKRQLENRDLQECVEEYNKITDSTETREDVDFFLTVKHLAKEFNINWMTKKHRKNAPEPSPENKEKYEEQEKVVNDYLSELNTLVEQGKIVLEFIWAIILFITPMVIFLLCIVFSEFGMGHITKLINKG